MAASLNFVQIDAIIDDATRVPLTTVTNYELQAPKAAATISIGATSFSNAQVKIQGMPGSLSTVGVTGNGVELVATLHSKDDDSELRRYVFSVKQIDVAIEGEKMEKMVAQETKHAHAHSHGGVPCTHDHGYVADEQPKHSHSHGDGKPCTEDHGHSHAAAEQPKHSHSHGDGKACTADHGHSHSGHGHGAGADEHMVDADGGKFQWSQDSDTVTVEVPVPAGTLGKEVKCMIGVDYVLVQIATMAPESRTVFDGHLFAKVSKDNCSWSIVQEKEKRLFVLTLSKMEHLKSWDSVMAAK